MIMLEWLQKWHPKKSQVNMMFQGRKRDIRELGHQPWRVQQPDGLADRSSRSTSWKRTVPALRRAVAHGRLHHFIQTRYLLRHKHWNTKKGAKYFFQLFNFYFLKRRSRSHFDTLPLRPHRQDRNVVTNHYISALMSDNDELFFHWWTV